MTDNIRTKLLLQNAILIDYSVFLTLGNEWWEDILILTPNSGRFQVTYVTIYIYWLNECQLYQYRKQASLFLWVVSVLLTAYITIGSSTHLINLILWSIRCKCPIKIKLTCTVQIFFIMLVKQERLKFDAYLSFHSREWFWSCLCFWCMRKANSAPFSCVLSIPEVISSCCMELLTWSCFSLELSSIKNYEFWAHNKAAPSFK